MKRTKMISGVFAVLAAVIAMAAIVIAFGSLNAPPVLLKASDDAVETAEHLLNAVCQGDYAAAGSAMYGNPDLGVHEAADQVGQLIWDSFVESFAYEMVGQCHATDSGLAQNVKITSLNMQSITVPMGEYAQSLLTERVEQAVDVSQIYDENNEYREDFVQDVLYDAAAKALEQDAEYSETEITLNLVYSQGKWWVMPEQALIAAISGGIAG